MVYNIFNVSEPFQRLLYQISVDVEAELMELVSKDSQLEMEPVLEIHFNCSSYYRQV